MLGVVCAALVGGLWFTKPRTFTLNKDIDLGGETFKAGQRVEFEDADETFIKGLVDDGAATEVTTDEPVKVKTVGEPETKTSDDAETTVVTVKDVEGIVKKIAEDNAKATKELVEALTKAQRGPQIKVHERSQDDPQRGYKWFGEFLKELKYAGRAGESASERLRPLHAHAAKTVGSDEMTTVEESLGGFLIPPAFDPTIREKGVEIDWMRGNGAMVLPVPAGSSLNINAISDVTRNASQLFGGIWVYRQHERKQLTITNAEFEQIELKPKILTGLVACTDNLLAGAPALGAFLGARFRDAILFKELNEAINGSGVGEFLGLLNAGCKIECAKENGQVAATIVPENLSKMRMYMRDEEYATAVWMAGATCRPQLDLMALDVGTGGAPIGIKTISESGVERILGRPLIYTEHCAALGTAGDIILVNWPDYYIGESIYADTASSIHLRFDYNETMFRFTKANDAQPWWRTTLTLQNAHTVSPVVTLAARA
jgi:HK97 family phage major capsid protein